MMTMTMMMGFEVALNEQIVIWTVIERQNLMMKMAMIMKALNELPEILVDWMI